MVSEWWIIKYKGYGRKRSWPYLRYYPSTCLEGLSKTMRNLSQDRQSPGRDLYPGLHEYEARVLTTWPRHSVFTWRTIIKLSTVQVWLGIKLINLCKLELWRNRTQYAWKCSVLNWTQEINNTLCSYSYIMFLDILWTCVTVKKWKRITAAVAINLNCRRPLIGGPWEPLPMKW
jgi:hypothetical protein